MNDCLRFPILQRVHSYKIDSVGTGDKRNYFINITYINVKLDFLWIFRSSCGISIVMGLFCSGGGAGIRPFRSGGGIPKICVARSTSSTVTIQFVMRLFCINFLNTTVPGHPKFCCNKRSDSAFLTCRFENKDLLKFTVLRRHTGVCKELG